MFIGVGPPKGRSGPRALARKVVKICLQNGVFEAILRLKNNV